MAYTIAHEFTHFMEQQSPAKFQAFTDALFAELDVDVEAEIESKAEELKQQHPEQYKNASRETLLADARSEVVAEACETMLTDTDAAQRIGQILKAKDATLFEKVKQWFRDLATKLREAYKDLDPDSPIAQYAKKTIQQVDGLVQMWADMAVDAAENYREGAGNGNVALDGGVKYSLNKNAETELHRALYDKNFKGEVLLRDVTPDIMLSQKGVRNLPMSMNASHIRENVFSEAEAVKMGLRTGKGINYHGIGEGLFLKIIDGLDNVREAYRGTKNADNPSRSTNYFLLISEFSDSDGNRINVPVYIDEHGSVNNVILDVNKISTVYGKRNLQEYIQRQVKNGNLIRIKNRSNLTSESQAPIARDYGEKASKYSIRNTEPVVNQKNSDRNDLESDFYNAGVKYSDRDSDGRQLSEEQQEYFKESEVRDDDGNLVPVYHQTFDDFYTFKRDKLGEVTLKNANDASLAATSLVGHWFSDHDLSQNIGGNALKCYLDIKNPYYTDLDSLAAEIGSYADDAEKMQDHFEMGQFNMVRKSASEFVRWLRSNGYDGIFVSDREFGGTSYVILNSRQAKLTTNENPTGRNDIRYSQRQQDQQAALEKQNGVLSEGDTPGPYSYESLTSKPDMVVTPVGGNVPNNRADVVYQAKQNAAKVGKFNPKDGSVSVYVKDVGRNVVLGTAGLKHSLDRRMDTNASITLHAGEIIQNSIRINELTPQKAEADGTYILIGAAENLDGELFTVRSVINQFSNELESMDVLYAINAKKRNRLRSMRPGFQGPVTDSTISISELLDYVNQYFPDVLPEDVLKHYGHDARPAGKLGESALYAERGEHQGDYKEELAKTRAKMEQDAKNERDNFIREYQAQRHSSVENWRRTEIDTLQKSP